MAENLDVLNTAVSLLIRAALLAARFSGRVRQRSLRRLASRDIDAKAKEILFLKDRVCQLEMQVSILQKHLHRRRQKLARYLLHVPITSGPSTRQRSCVGACGPSKSWWPSTTSPARLCASLLWKVPTPDGSSRLWSRPYEHMGHPSTSSPTKPVASREMHSPNG